MRDGCIGRKGGVWRRTDMQRADLSIYLAWWIQGTYLRYLRGRRNPLITRCTMNSVLELIKIDLNSPLSPSVLNPLSITTLLLHYPGTYIQSVQYHITTQPQPQPQFFPSSPSQSSSLSYSPSPSPSSTLSALSTHGPAPLLPTSLYPSPHSLLVHTYHTARSAMTSAHTPVARIAFCAVLVPIHRCCCCSGYR